MRDESTGKGKVYMTFLQHGTEHVAQTDTQQTKVPGEQCTVLHHWVKECVLLREPHCSLYN